MSQLTIRNRIKTLFDAGIASAPDIIRRTKLPRSTVFRIVKRIRNQESLEHKQGAGAPHKCSYRQKKSIITTLSRCPRIKLRELRAKMSSKFDNSLSTNTIYRVT